MYISISLFPLTLISFTGTHNLGMAKLSYGKTESLGGGDIHEVGSLERNLNRCRYRKNLAAVTSRISQTLGRESGHTQIRVDIA